MVYGFFCVWDLTKLISYAYISFWLCLLRVCGVSWSRCCQKGSGTLCNIHGLYADLDELAVAGADYDVLVCAESKVSDLRHLLKLRIPGFS